MFVTIPAWIFHEIPVLDMPDIGAIGSIVGVSVEILVGTPGRISQEISAWLQGISSKTPWKNHEEIRRNF